MKADYITSVNPTEQPREFQKNIDASMDILTKPLPSYENGSPGDLLPIDPLSQRKIIQTVDPKTPEGQKRLQEARRNATRKLVYVKAIVRHCRECFGKVPVREDCGGHTLIDGTACNLYPYNTAKKCKQKHCTKAALKRAIRKECKECGGEGDASCGKCNLLSVVVFRKGKPFIKHPEDKGPFQRDIAEG